MAQVLQGSNPKGSQTCTGAIDVGEWKSSSTKGGDEIPPLGSNTYTCNCRYCKAILKETDGWTKATKKDVNIDMKIGDRVLIQEALPGVVKYIGDLDSDYTNDQIYIGVKLDDPVGDHDGVFKNKRFFECPNLHGVIVPIEEVNLLVPADGRTITVNKGPANKFFSMPEFADLGSLASNDNRLDSGYDASETTSQTMSEGRLSTPLPEYHFRSMVTPPSTDVVASTKDEQDYPKKNLIKLSKENGITRSGVFICDQPGSIAACISSSESANSMKERLLKSLSHHCSPASEVTMNDFCVSEEDQTVEEVIILPDDTKSSPLEDSVVASTTSVPPTPAPSVCSRGLLKKSQKASMSAVINRPFASKMKMTGSKSAASPISMKKNGPGVAAPVISKLATTKVATPVAKAMSKAKSDKSDSSKKSLNKDTSNAEVEKEPESQQENNAVVEQATEKTAKDEAEVNSQQTKDTPAVPRLQFVPDNDGEKELAKGPDVEATTSYTGRLLSNLPMEDTITPLSVNAQMDDVIDFDEWAQKWGGGTKGWAQAQTLQKLKDAQRKGLKEVEWQQTIEELEKDEEFAPRVRSIKNLREEINKVRVNNKTTEEELQEQRAQLHSSQLLKEVAELEAQTKALRQTNEALLEKIIGHPLFTLVKEAIEYLGMDVTAEASDKTDSQ